MSDTKKQDAYLDSSTVHKKVDSFSSLGDSESGDSTIIATKGYDEDLEWTREEEARVIRILDIRLMPLILVMSFVLNMDRTNLSNAVSDNLAADLGFTNDDVNNTIMVYSIIFTIVTLVANVIAKRIGPHRWIPILMSSWAIVTWAHALIHNFGGFIAVRMLIALTEAGFIPACLVYLTGWYKSNELATRLAWFWGIQSLASAFSGVISFGIFRMSGIANLYGWKWLFLIDGLMTHVVGFFAFFYLPRSPTETKRFFTGDWFKNDERLMKIAVTRLIKDDKAKTEHHQFVGIKDIKLFLKDTKVWMHLVATFVAYMPITPIQTYLPSIIRSAGFETTTANLLTAPSYIVNGIFSILIAWSSDRYGDVGLHIVISVIWQLAGYIALRALPVGTDRWSLFAAAMVTAAAPSWHGMHIAWMSSNVAPSGKRALALGAIIGAANICSVPGAYIYQTYDLPRYFTGNTVNVALDVAALLLFTSIRFRYILTNRYRERKWSAMTEQERETYRATTVDQGSDRLDHRFRI